MNAFYFKGHNITTTPAENPLCSENCSGKSHKIVSLYTQLQLIIFVHARSLSWLEKQVLIRKNGPGAHHSIKRYQIRSTWRCADRLRLGL